MKYREKLDQMEVRYAELTAQMADPDVISDGDQYRKISKTHSDLTEIVSKYREFKVAEDGVAQEIAFLASSAIGAGLIRRGRPMKRLLFTAAVLGFAGSVSGANAPGR